MRSIGPALALGNAVVLKPDVNTPVTGGVVIARLFEEAGLPDGVLHVLPGGADVGQALVADPNVRMISFTGSTAAGRLVGETAGRMLKRVVLELGGNSPLVVLDDADIEAASSAGAWGSFLHQGQICIAVSRHLVHESIVEEYTAALVERARRLPSATRRPTRSRSGRSSTRSRSRACSGSSTRASRRVRACSPAARTTARSSRRPCSATSRRHARVRRGDLRPGRAGDLVPRPTSDAVELANGTDYGLAAAVQSASPQRARAVADRLRAGMVHVNDQTVNEEPPAPFGGFGVSSNGGHFGGVANLELWTEWQWVTSRDKAAPFPF